MSKARAAGDSAKVAQASMDLAAAQASGQSVGSVGEGGEGGGLGWGREGRRLGRLRLGFWFPEASFLKRFGERGI